MEHAEIVIAPYRVLACGAGLPQLYEHYQQHAKLAEEFELTSGNGTACFFGVGRDAEWPMLVVAQRYEPSGFGFHPGILVVPETATVFIGAGERLLAYRLEPHPVRLWADKADVGFWSWSRFGEFVLMSAEIELAAWTQSGVKLWSTFVEPPWTYTVTAGVVDLDVMGTKSSFPISGGPKAG